jgi:hypothetical protein
MLLYRLRLCQATYKSIFCARIFQHNQYNQAVISDYGVNIGSAQHWSKDVKFMNFLKFERKDAPEGSSHGKWREGTYGAR